MTIEYRERPELITVRGATDLCAMAVVAGLYVSENLPDVPASSRAMLTLYKAGTELLVSDEGLLPKAEEGVKAEIVDPRLAWPPAPGEPDYRTWTSIDGNEATVAMRAIAWASRVENTEPVHARIMRAKLGGEAIKGSPLFEAKEELLWSHLGVNPMDELFKVRKIHAEAKRLKESIDAQKPHHTTAKEVGGKVIRAPLGFAAEVGKGYLNSRKARKGRI